RGLAERADPQVHHVRGERATRSRAGGHPVPGRGLPGRGPEGEDAEGDPPRVRVYPVAVPGGNGQLRGLDRRGQVSPARWLHSGATSDSVAGAPTMDGENKLLAAPDSVADAYKFSGLERDPYSDDGGES